MSIAASSPPPAERPRADPQELRRYLPPALLSQFDQEWELVLERAKHAKELAPIQELLAKWQQIAAAEAGSPGIYERVHAKAAEIERTGRNTTAGSIEDMRDLINCRLAR